MQYCFISFSRKSKKNLFKSLNDFNVFLRLFFTFYYFYFVLVLLGFLGNQVNKSRFIYLESLPKKMNKKDYPLPKRPSPSRD